MDWMSVYTPRFMCSVVLPSVKCWELIRHEGGALRNRVRAPVGRGKDSPSK